MRFTNLLQTQPIDSLDVQQELAAVAEKLSTPMCRFAEHSIAHATG